MGERTLAGGKPAKRAQPPECDKIKWSPGGVTESTASAYCIAFCHPCRDSDIFFNIPGAASADALLPPASVLTPLPGLIFRSPALANCPPQIPICRLVRSGDRNRNSARADRNRPWRAVEISLTGCRNCCPPFRRQQSLNSAASGCLIETLPPLRR